MKKSQSILIVLLFSLFIGLVAILSLVLPKRDFSETENRYLERIHEFNSKSVFSGSFSDDASDYISDHIAGRDFWVRCKAELEKLSGKTENNDVFFCTDKTLIKRVNEPDSEKLMKNIGYVNRLASSAGVPVYFGVIPTAASIWQYELPVGAPTADESAYIEKMYAACDARCIDISYALNAHKTEDIYYRTDHHWTSLGAYYGANAVFDCMGLPPLDISAYEKKTVSRDFYGTVWSSSGGISVSPDNIDIYVPEIEDGCLYHSEYLDKKDKYSYFLGGNQPLCVIDTHKGGEKLLVIRDSYADSLSPFLTERFSEIHLFDLRYNRMKITDYIEENGIDCVLVLYGFDNIKDDPNLVFMTR